MVLVSPYPCQHLLLSLFILAIPVNMKLHLTVILICISLMVNLFMCLFSYLFMFFVCVLCFLEQCLQFLIGLFLLLSYKFSLYILDISSTRNRI